MLVFCTYNYCDPLGAHSSEPGHKGIRNREHTVSVEFTVNRADAIPEKLLIKSKFVQHALKEAVG
jgi:hypothetical protein